MSLFGCFATLALMGMVLAEVDTCHGDEKCDVVNENPLDENDEQDEASLLAIKSEITKIAKDFGGVERTDDEEDKGGRFGASMKNSDDEEDEGALHGTALKQRGFGGRQGHGKGQGGKGGKGTTTLITLPPSSLLEGKQQDWRTWQIDDEEDEDDHLFTEFSEVPGDWQLDDEEDKVDLHGAALQKDELEEWQSDDEEYEGDVQGTALTQRGFGGREGHGKGGKGIALRQSADEEYEGDLQGMALKQRGGSGGRNDKDQGESKSEGKRKETTIHEAIHNMSWALGIDVPEVQNDIMVPHSAHIGSSDAFSVAYEVRKSKVHGMGTFLREPVKKGQPIWRYLETKNLLLYEEDMPALKHALASVDPQVQWWFFQWSYAGDPPHCTDCIVVEIDDDRYMNDGGPEEANLADVPGSWTQVAKTDLEAGTELLDDYSNLAQSPKWWRPILQEYASLLQAHDAPGQLNRWTSVLQQGDLQPIPQHGKQNIVMDVNLSSQ